MALLPVSGPPPQADEILFRWGGRYDLVLGRYGEEWLMASSFDGVFLIDEARRRIRCFVEDPADLAWQDVFVRRVLPRVAMLFGGTIAHGAAVAHDGAALLLLGQSGAGKSTLSAALAHAGWDILSDDISVMWNPSAPHVAPATTGVCVWDDSRAALGLPLDRCVPMPGYGGKVRYVSGNDRGIELLPLSGIVFLARSADQAAPEHHQLTPAQGLMRAVHHRIRFNPAAAHSGETLKAFGELSEIVGATRSWELAYPARYDALPEVAAVLQGLLKQ